MSSLPLPRLNRLGFPVETPVEFLTDEEREALLATQAGSRLAESTRRFQAEPLTTRGVTEAAFGQRPAELQTFMDESGVPRSPFGPIVQGAPQDEDLTEARSVFLRPDDVDPFAPISAGRTTATPQAIGGQERPQIRILDASGQLRTFEPAGGAFEGFSRGEIAEAGAAARAATVQPSPFEPEPGPFGSRPTGISRAISRFQKAGRLPVAGESKEAFQLREAEAQFDRINRRLREMGLPGVGNPAREADIEVSLREADVDLGSLLREKAELSARLPDAELAEVEATSPELRESAFREALGIRQRVNAIDTEVAAAERALNRATTRVGEELSFAAGRDPIAERIERLRKPEGFVASALTEGELVPEKVADLMRRERSRERTRAKRAVEAQATADAIVARQKAEAVKKASQPIKFSVRRAQAASTLMKSLKGQSPEVARRILTGIVESGSPADVEIARIASFFSLKELQDDPKKAVERMLNTQLLNRFQATVDDAKRRGLPEPQLNKFLQAEKKPDLADVGTLQLADKFLTRHAKWLEDAEIVRRNNFGITDPGLIQPVPPHPLKSLFAEGVDFFQLEIGQIYDALIQKFGKDSDKLLRFDKTVAKAEIPSGRGSAGKPPSGSPAFNELVAQLIAAGSLADARAILFTKRPASLSTEEKAKIRDEVLPFLRAFFAEGGPK